MTDAVRRELLGQIEELKQTGMYKYERIITTAQGPHITVEDGREMLNFCANNYLGLSGDTRIAEAACAAMNRWGYGLSSVRFICGTQQLHRELENRLSRFLGTEDTLLYAACFDANGGLFEPLLGADDALISDELNHASIIDGIRLCKAQRYRYRRSDMKDLERCLQEASAADKILIATDGVFSMDGDIARLDEICNLAETYNALVMVDDSHATGFIGETGRGTAEHCGVTGRVDIITTTLGKALGGASGGCTSGRREIIDLLRQKSRPYLFSNTLAPAVAGGTLKVLDLLEESAVLKDRLFKRANVCRQRVRSMGFDVVEGNTPIIPIMIYDERTAAAAAEKLLEEGIYVVGFVYPVVPKGKARIRMQISASHTEEDLEKLFAALDKVGREMGLIG
ncbi:MAG: glycine C-acetyltransferase [Spirochaetales bacterium]|jgi:glycine C-acetyltransferase|nr:glycine C-acetyltransferase [Spirochaetales bacterium]